jgi:hypothetical protein
MRYAMRMRDYLTFCAAALLLLGACKSDTEASSGSGGSSATSTTSATGTGGSEWPWLPAQHAACPPGGCPAPLQCISYCGLAGCSTTTGGGGTAGAGGSGGSGGSTTSGEISTCEIPCDPSAPNCPSDEICVNISDGPGDVCSMP